jgi:hypothetical protein
METKNNYGEIKMSIQIENALSLDEVVNLINDSKNDGAWLASEYAVSSAQEQLENDGYEITEASCEAHLDVLVEAGAKFDYAAALESCINHL